MTDDMTETFETLAEDLEPDDQTAGEVKGGFRALSRVNLDKSRKANVIQR